MCCLEKNYFLHLWKKMPATLHATPPPDNGLPYSGHILWAPKKKQSFRKRNFIPSTSRVHSKCRKRLEFSNVEDFVESSEKAKNSSKDENAKLEGQDSVPVTPNLKLIQERQETVEQNNLKFLRPICKQDAARGSQAPTAKRKLNLSTFR